MRWIVSIPEVKGRYPENVKHEISNDLKGKILKMILTENVFSEI